MNNEEEVNKIEPREEKKGLRQQMEEINEKLDIVTKTGRKFKNKKPKLPYGVKSKLKKLARKNSVMVLLLKNNKAIMPKIAKIENGLVYVDKRYHGCAIDNIFLWMGKYPTIVLPEWDLLPIGTKDYYDAMDNNRKVDAQTVIIRAMETAETPTSKKMGGKVILWLVIGAGILLYVLFGGK